MSGYWFAPARSGPVTRTVPTASKADVPPERQASSARIISASDDVGLPTIPVIEFPPDLPAGTMEHAAEISHRSANPPSKIPREFLTLIAGDACRRQN